MSDQVLHRYFPKVPDGWKLTPIRQALEVVDEPIVMRDNELYDLVSIRRGYGGLFHRSKLPGKEILTKTLRRVVPGTFILARMQVVHGATAYAAPEFAGSAISKSYSSFRGRDGCETRYFTRLAEHPLMKAYFMDASHGVVIEKMTFDQERWLDFRIPLPPRDEQLRILDVLDALDEEIAATKKVVSKLRVMKAGLYSKLLDAISAPFYPLGSVADVRNGTTPSRVRTDYWNSGTVPWLASGKVNDYLVDSPSELVTTRAVSDCNLKLIPAGSIIVGMIGQGKTRGMAARLDIAATINQNLAGIVPGPGLRSDFLHHYLVHSYVRLRSSARGSNQDALNTQLVSSFRVPVPSLDEQARLSSAFDAMDERIRNEGLTLTKLRQLRDGLSDDLFTGRVRIPVETMA